MVEKYKLKNLVFYRNTDNIEFILKASDIFVCSSLSESGPMCVWEAMAMGKAIVSTDVGDVNRYIRHGLNGFIVPKCDLSALVDNVACLVENEELRERFGRNVRNVAVRKLDISKCVEKHRIFYEEVLNN